MFSVPAVTLAVAAALKMIWGGFANLWYGETLIKREGSTLYKSVCRMKQAMKKTKEMLKWPMDGAAIMYGLVTEEVAGLEGVGFWSLHHFLTPCILYATKRTGKQGGLNNIKQLRDWSLEGGGAWS